MKLYVAGPMAGLPDFNYPAFYAAEKQLVEAGYEVENPARNELPKDRPADEPMWLGFMRMSLVQISRVDGLALLPGWSNSAGAKLEEHIGQGLKLPVRYVETWLRPEMIADVQAKWQATPGDDEPVPYVLGAEPVLCPECVNQKPVNCVGEALHPDTDELVACGSVR